jgi:hypothetical protein
MQMAVVHLFQYRSDIILHFPHSLSRMSVTKLQNLRKANEKPRVHLLSANDI